MRTWYGTALAALALAGCGGGGATGAGSSPTPSATTASTPPPTANDVRAALRTAAISEEAYAADNGRYTTDLDALAESGLSVPPGITVAVVSATQTRYCVSAAGGGVTFYYDSDNGRPQTTPCR